MRRLFFSLLFLSICHRGIAEEPPQKPPFKKHKSSGYASRDATVLSMMGWGVALFATIATISTLVHGNPEPQPNSNTTP